MAKKKKQQVAKPAKKKKKQVAKRDPAALAKTARHEAGHAVISYRLGSLVGPVTIIPDMHEGIAGTSVTYEEHSPAASIITLYAGRAAAKRFDPARGDQGCEDDDEQATELLVRHSTMALGAGSRINRQKRQIVGAIRGLARVGIS